MKEGKKENVIASSEQVDKLINDYYAADYQKMDYLLKGVSAECETKVNIDEIITKTNFQRETARKDISRYEDELVQMTDLATILSETQIKDMQEYVNYLIEKNMEVLPDIIDIIQLLKK